MRLSFKIDKRGFNNQLETIKRNINNAFESSVNDGGNDIVRDAKILSSDVPSISNSIQLNRIENGIEVTTGNGMEDPRLTAWYEFGTGNYAAALVPGMPEDWQRMAKKYFINGKGTLPAQPYLYPAFQRMKANIEQTIISKI